MSLKIPNIIGHRGVCGYAPENTIESIHTAADMGVEWVELDVKLTKDGIPIIFHDDTLERTTNGSGAIKETSYKDIKLLEAGSWFGDSFAGLCVPSLEEAVDALIERDLGLNLEIKPCPGRERETAEVALDYLSQIWDDHERLLISSFEPSCLEAAQEMAEDWSRGLLLGGEEIPENWQEMTEYLSVSTLNISKELCKPELIATAQEKGLPVLVYTVNDIEQVRDLQSLGVSHFFSDVPDVIKEGLLTLH